MEGVDNVLLSPDDLRKVDLFDSREFGFLNLNTNPEKVHDRKLIIKGILHYEKKLLTSKKTGVAQSSQNGGESEILTNSSITNQEISQIYLKLGHLHLLTDDFAKALSAYQNYYNSCEESWKNPSLLYGLGLVYFHFNAHKCVVQLFRELLYGYPNFVRSNEVHLRLGMSYKALENFELALKHLNAAKVGTGPCSVSKLDINFYIAYCYDVQGTFKKAREEYDAILQAPNCTVQLKASVLRQLGWLCFRAEFLGDKMSRLNYAIEYLQESLKLDPTCGKTHYYLGRCLSAIGRAHDAFVSYRHSIDKTESSADTWCSIGVLYQQQQQPTDALQAFICAVQLDETHTEAWIDLGLLYEKYGQPKDALQCFSNSLKHNPKGSTDALTSRVKLLEGQLKNAPTPPASYKKTLPSLEEAWHLPIPAELTNRQDMIQKQKIAMYIRGALMMDVNMHENDDAVKAPCYLTPQQIQLMQVLQQNQGQLNPHQMQILRQLQEAYALSSQQQKMIQRSMELGNSVVVNDHLNGGMRFAASSAEMPAGELPQVSQEDLQAFLGISGESEDLVGTAADRLRDLKHDPILSTAFLSSSNDQSVQDQEITSTTYNDRLLASTSSNSNHLPPPTLIMTATVKLPVNSTSASVVVEMAKNRGRPGYSWPIDEIVPPPQITAPSPVLNVSKDKLLLPTPSIIVDTKKDAIAPELQQFCYQSPIAVVRGMASALRLDLGLFSTKSLMETASDHQVEVRTQMLQAPDKNFNVNNEKHWYCESTRSFTTVSKYAQYQAQSFQLSLKEEQDKMKPLSGRNSISSVLEAEALSKKNQDDGQSKILKFGTNVDLSDEKKWKIQLEELNKLPAFCRVSAGSNMLSHLGHIVLGMNTVQLYMKVPGCRTPGHQENLNFASVNINIGPGECEWFGVPFEHWGAIKELCEKNKVDFLRGSWWPPLEDLWENNIPVYRFTQKPGDLVWVGPGTVHWVQATGWCNNIAWNIGSITPTQYHMAIERYEWNKLESYKSIVPMIHLSWQLARNVKFSDAKMFEMIKASLVRSLCYCVTTLEYVTNKLHKEIKHHPRVIGEIAHYCAVCDQEVFNVLFVMEQERKFYVHCLNCALRMDPDLKPFIILHQYLLDELISTFDNFQLIAKRPGLIC